MSNDSDLFHAGVCEHPEIHNKHTLGAGVVAYHAMGDLDKFLNAWENYKGGHVSLGIFLVEATDAELQIAEKDFRFQNSVVEHSGTNIGYGRSCNYIPSTLDIIALRDNLPLPDTYAFFNADTCIREGVLQHCMETLWSNDDYGVLGPKQVNEKDQITHAGIFNPLVPQHRNWLQLDRPGLDDIRDDCATVSGSAYFVKRSVWEELAACAIYQESFPDATGAFAPTRLYYEETLCSYHARAHGYKVVYDGQAKMEHRWHQSIMKNPGYSQQCFRESQAIFRAFCDKHDIPRD